MDTKFTTVVAALAVFEDLFRSDATVPYFPCTIFVPVRSDDEITQTERTLYIDRAPNERALFVFANQDRVYAANARWEINGEPFVINITAPRGTQRIDGATITIPEDAYRIAEEINKKTQ